MFLFISPLHCILLHILADLHVEILQCALESDVKRIHIAEYIDDEQCVIQCILEIAY